MVHLQVSKHTLVVFVSALTAVVSSLATQNVIDTGIATAITTLIADVATEYLSPTTAPVTQ